MANRRPHRGARTALFIGITLGTASAMAGYDVYSKDDTKLTFNLDAVAAAFDNQDSWFGESNAFLGNNTDNWGEFGIEPRLSLELPVGKGTVYGQVSGVYTSTLSDDASGLTIGLGEEADHANVEQGHLGWKVDNVFGGLENDTFSISAGRQDYSIGSGMLINDGGADGGEHGGWYIGMRKAFKESVIARLKSDELLLEGFRLKNRPRRGGTEGEASGVNGEYTFFGSTKLGATYMLVDAEIPGYDDLDVYDGRLDWTPGGALEGLTLSGEFAHEDSDQIDADGWFAKIGYQFKDICWTPTFSYRYAHFDGDDLDTPEDEQFREIAYGYTDYGSWYQGEITGNYPLANGNLISHQLRIKAQPNDSVTLNLIYYDFTLDQQQVFGDPVTSDDWGQEIDFTVDWQATEQIYVIGVLGVLSPGDAAEEWVGNDQDWLYSMLYVSYSY
jgi:hypothetical protein